MRRSTRVDLVHVVDQRAAGGPVAWVGAAATADPVPPAVGVTLEEWRARQDTGLGSAARAGGGDWPEPHRHGVAAGAAGRGIGLDPGPPAPFEDNGGQGTIPGRHPNRTP